MEQKRKRILNLILRMIGLGLFIWVLARVDLASALANLRKAHVGFVVLGVAMAFPIVLVRAWRLRRILKTFDVPISLRQAMLIRLVGAAAGDMLPGRTGEAITLVYLQRVGYGLRDPALTMILDRLFDFVILAIWALAGLSLISPPTGRSSAVWEIQSMQAILIAAAIGFSLVILFLLVLRSRPGSLSRLGRKLLPPRLQKMLDSLAVAGPHRSRRGFSWNAGVVFVVVTASLVSFALLVLRGYLLSRAIGIGLSLPYLAACMAVTTLLQLIPVSNVLGIGTREVSLVYLFGLAGVSAEQAVGFSFLIMVALLAQDSVGLFLWWRYPAGSALPMERETLQVEGDL